MSMPIQRYVVIPTHNRPNELQQLVASLIPHVSGIIIVDNASTPPVMVSDVMSIVESFSHVRYIDIIYDNEQPPNLSRLWNVGLDAAQQHAQSCGDQQWDVIVLNDDAIIPGDWFDIVTLGLRKHNVAVACTSSIRPTTSDSISTVCGEGSVLGRMCPWAFITRGELMLRANEQLRWWWGDTDFDWQARQSGGVALLAGPVVVNEHANSSTVGALAEQAGRDAATFKAKWGRLPW